MRCQTHSIRTRGCRQCLQDLEEDLAASHERDRIESGIVLVPKELLLSWAAGLVRAVCAPCDDEIAESVRSTALQMKKFVDAAMRPRL